MAEVFAGHAVGDHGFQKPVAIKRLLPARAHDDVFVGRLIEEAKLVVGMQHGNIVSVLDLAREADAVFLVMEFVDGPSLRQLIKARGARGLSLGVATYIVQSAAAGLAFAHARPGGAIIHADVSPSNLLLTASGEVRVADFGIARREGVGDGMVEGKWAYMAPEQARGEPLAPQADVFALGVVLYELLTGRHPFGLGITAYERDDRLQVAPPRQVKPSVPHGLDAICMRALAHDPRARYSRMQQLIDALVEERFANGYRDGAAELAHAIRQAQPQPELGGSATLAGTPDVTQPSSRSASASPSRREPPQTIVTRSLLREVTPTQRAASPGYPLRPLDPPPRDQFPILPTAWMQTTARSVEDSPPGGAPVVPSSGGFTTICAVDPAILAELAAAEARDTAAMPVAQPERHATDELAIAVPALPRHGPEPATSPRGQRMPLVVLAVAALIGIVTGLAFQLHPARRRGPRAGVIAAVPASPLAGFPARPLDATAVESARGSTPPQPVVQPTLPGEAAVTRAATPAAEARPAKLSASKGAGRKPQPGTLSVRSSPRSWVTIGAQTVPTPGEFSLLPGTYLVKLRSDETGVTKYEPITINAGEVRKLDVPMMR